MMDATVKNENIQKAMKTMSAHVAEPKQVKTPKPVVAKCEICELEFTHMDTYDGHMKGARHKKKMSTLVVKKALAEKGIDEKKMVVCDVCDVIVNSAVEMKNHVSGKKHKRKLAAKEGGTAPEEANKKLATKPGKDGAPAKDDNTITVQLVIPECVKKFDEAESDYKFLCIPCQAKCNSEQQLHQHLNSNKHTDKLERLNKPPPPPGARGRGRGRGRGTSRFSPYPPQGFTADANRRGGRGRGRGGRFSRNPEQTEDQSSSYTGSQAGSYFGNGSNESYFKSGGWGNSDAFINFQRGEETQSSAPSSAPPNQSYNRSTSQQKPFTDSPSQMSVSRGREDSYYEYEYEPSLDNSRATKTSYGNASWPKQQMSAYGSSQSTGLLPDTVNTFTAIPPAKVGVPSYVGATMDSQASVYMDTGNDYSNYYGASEYSVRGTGRTTRW